MDAPRPGPTYDLATIKALVSSGQFVVTGEALNGAGELGFDRSDIVACVMSLTAADFHKTMPSIKKQGLWQDVYRPVHSGIALYVKLQLAARSDGRALSVVVQFKRK